MFDSRYLAFATISALLVLSPGPSLAVVLNSAIEEGKAMALATVVGVNVGNSTLALASALGMAVVFARWPWSLQLVKGAGVLYLTWLGVRALWRLWRGPVGPGGPGAVASPGGARREGDRKSAGSAVVRGTVTNLLNPSVVIFYMTFLPQFIGPRDPFLPRFLLLAVTHVSMSLGWLSMTAVTLGAFSERMARPGVRRAMDALTGLVLIGFGARLLVR